VIYINSNSLQRLVMPFKAVCCRRKDEDQKEEDNLQLLKT